MTPLQPLKFKNLPGALLTSRNPCHFFNHWESRQEFYRTLPLPYLYPGPFVHLECQVKLRTITSESGCDTPMTDGGTSSSKDSYNAQITWHPFIKEGSMSFNKFSRFVREAGCQVESMAHAGYYTDLNGRLIAVGDITFDKLWFEDRSVVRLRT